MDKTIKLPTHDLSNNYLEQIGDSNSYKYVLKTDMDWVRQGFLDEDTYFIDPSGGPMLIVGDKLPGSEKYFIKSIHHKKHVGFIVTLKEKE
jgi:hypothetical protein